MTTQAFRLVAYIVFLKLVLTFHVYTSTRSINDCTVSIDHKGKRLGYELAVKG